MHFVNTYTSVNTDSYNHIITFLPKKQKNTKKVIDFLQ